MPPKSISMSVCSLAIVTPVFNTAVRTGRTYSMQPAVTTNSNATPDNTPISPRDTRPINFANDMILLLADRYVETALFPFVFDVYIARSLMIEQHLAENQFKIILVHIIARTRYLIITHIREVERRSVTVATLRNRIDIAAALQRTDIRFCT